MISIRKNKFVKKFLKKDMFIYRNIWGGGKILVEKEISLFVFKFRFSESAINSWFEILFILNFFLYW